ncbi:MAG: riboflavin synthase [Solirubrobacteraceae bacterium]
MFTGLIADLGAVEAVEATEDGARLRVASALAGELREGGSVAVNGVCLTATHVEEGGFAADVVRETLRRSTIAAVAPGDAVNLELPLRATDRLGGHVVQGHVDGTGTVEHVRDEGFSRVITIAVPDDLERYLVEKGSVAVDGISLTVASLDGARFAVALIPETLERTTLGRAQPGTPVNLEVDVLAKHIERLMPR